MKATSNRLLVKNSVFLYGRMLITVVLNLWITRIVLQSLGSDGFGTYGVVGSIVTIFSVFNSGIINSNQRFITYEIGKPDGHPNEVFNSLLNLILIFAVVIFFIMEIAGLWYIHNKAKIPEHLMGEAVWTFHFSVLTAIITLVSAPYNALVIAHERMNVFAIISVVQVILTFIGVSCLNLLNTQRLFAYGLLLLVVSVICRLAYQIYCKKNFRESSYRCFIDRSRLREMASFTGLNIIDGGLNTIAWQSIVLIINFSFGVIVNAAYVVATNLRNMVLSFAQNIQKAISPQITKTYAEGDYDRHCSLVYNGSKAQVYFLFLLVIPFIVETEYVLTLWLGEIPDFAIDFCRLCALMAVINAAFEVVRTSALATGKIKKLVIIPNLCFLFLLPLYIWINNKYKSPTLMMVVVLIADYLAYALRLHFAAEKSVFSQFVFYKKVIFPCFAIGTISFLICNKIDSYLPESFLSLLAITLFNGVLLTLLFYLIGINRKERLYINQHLSKYFR